MGKHFNVEITCRSCGSKNIKLHFDYDPCLMIVCKECKNIGYVEELIDENAYEIGLT